MTPRHKTAQIVMPQQEIPKKCGHDSSKFDTFLFKYLIRYHKNDCMTVRCPS